MRLTFIRILACVVFAGALIGVPVLVPGAQAQGGTRVVFSPSTASVGEGMTAAVEVRVEDVQGLYGLDIRIAFDPAVVEVVDADTSKSGIQVRAGELLTVDFMIRDTADNTAGTVWYALTQLNPSQPVSGSGTAFIIVFKGKQRGATSPLTITYQQLAAQTGTAILATAVNGEIRVVEPALAPPTPTTAPPPPQPTIPMPTAEPTLPLPTAGPTSQPTLEPTAAPATAEPPEPTPGVPGLTRPAVGTAAPTMTQAATQPIPATRAPELTPEATATAQAASPTRPALTATAEPSVQEPAGSQGGLVLRDILAGVAAVLVVAMMGGITGAVVRASKTRK